MSTASFVEAAHAAECTVLAMALRAMLLRARTEEPEVWSVICKVQPELMPGLAVIEVELQDGHGHAIGGWTL